MNLFVACGGEVRCLYDERFDLSVLGPGHIRRASHVEADAQGAWWADLAPVAGPRLGPYALRSQALTAEQAWLEDQLPGLILPI